MPKEGPRGGVMGTYIGLGHRQGPTLSYTGLWGPVWVKDDKVDMNTHAGLEGKWGAHEEGWRALMTLADGGMGGRDGLSLSASVHRPHSFYQQRACPKCGLTAITAFAMIGALA